MFLLNFETCVLVFFVFENSDAAAAVSAAPVAIISVPTTSDVKLTGVEVYAERVDVGEDVSVDELAQCVALHCASDTWHSLAVFLKVRSEKNVKVDFGDEALVPI